MSAGLLVLSAAVLGLFLPTPANLFVGLCFGILAVLVHLSRFLDA
jgi:hypothetical protein